MLSRAFVLVFVLVIILLVSLSEGLNEPNGIKFDDKNVAEGYEKVNLRRTRSHPEDEKSPADALTSDKVDASLLNDMGSAELAGGIVDRKRRDQGDVDLHVHRAESDAIAAAAESAAAEADAVAAAVEATEVEAAEHENEGRNHHVSTDYKDDNSMTFEETGDGDDVVVVDQDLREKEHDRGGNQHHGTSEFEMTHGDNMEIKSGGHVSHKSDSQTHGSHSPIGWRGHNSFISPSNSLESTPHGSGANYADVDTPLKTLLSESSGLAKEIRLIFQVLARREDYLVQEMEKLKIALQNAVKVLEESNKEAKIIRKRRDNDPNPYKACVYINPQGQTENFAPPQKLLQNHASDNNQPSTSTLTQENGDEVDLSSVYWLKLPENEDEGILEKVHRVLSGLRDSGKDVLFIPVTKGYMTNEDVAKGFLRAVQVKPAYDTYTDSKQRKRRKRFRLRIRRI